ncbi:cell division protein FtsP [Xenorhabdus vietnamensis]|uniref:Cell division protein FtsP n=1 Tax=Xenorhabdus vietnamensis TaxID=351656 RepID=A0A1Y2SFR3_9GAMM|nr:cell division protein FtsP [Xenorhabdus vietnamensis]OTA17603.1 cell division protein FtsP [Xenorhabdus vietnamensis]
MSLSRRQFIQASGVAMCLGAMPCVVRADRNKQTKLPIPPLLESRIGQPLFLAMQKARWSFNGHDKVKIWGFNGNYLGPTIRVRRGDYVKLIYNNRLSEPVSMTVAGLLAPGTLIGGSPHLMQPNGRWAPIIRIDQPATTCWYHANTPNQMAKHVYAGLAGMWLVEDETSRNLPLPKHYGVDDFPVILQDKRLDNFDAIEYVPLDTQGFLGNTLVVNGVENPFVEVARGWVRLRLLNASNARRYQLQLSDGRPFYMIGTDQGLLPAPVAVQLLSLAPGERREVLIDMSKVESVTITAGEPAGIMDRLKGLVSPSTKLLSTTVLTLKASGLLPLVTDKLPAQLVVDNPHINSSIQSRQIGLGDYSQGSSDKHLVDITSQQGAWERWIVTTSIPQPLHIEGVRFKVINLNGKRPEPQDYGWKDTVWIDSRAELLVNMVQPSYENFPFMYYSQILEMADRGVAGRLIVNPADF